MRAIDRNEENIFSVNYLNHHEELIKTLLIKAVVKEWLKIYIHFIMCYSFLQSFLKWSAYEIKSSEKNSNG